jgi:hypothetical protein
VQAHSALTERIIGTLEGSGDVAVQGHGDLAGEFAHAVVDHRGRRNSSLVWSGHLRGELGTGHRPVVVGPRLYCPDDRITPITLTADGDSPTGAQRLYERLSFSRSQTVTAFHRPITGAER